MNNPLSSHDVSPDDHAPNAKEHPTLSTLFLDGVQQLDPRQWTRLVETFGPIVYRWCRIAGVPDADAADVVQEVFTSVARRIGAFERQKDAGSFRCWLATITRNQIRDFFRKASRTAAGAGGSDAHQRLLAQPDRWEDSIDGDSIATPLLQTMLDSVRNEFEELTWQAFWMTTVESLRSSEVAERTGLSLASVYQAKSRVLKRLRTKLAEWPE